MIDDNDQDDVQQSGDPDNPSPPSTELALAQLANDAMSQSPKDAQAITARLHKSIAYLRANPQMAAYASEALGKNVAPADVASKLMGYVDQWQEPAPVQQPDQPGAVQRGLSNLVTAFSPSHIGGTLKNAVTAPFQSAYTALKNSSEMDAENALAGSTGQTGVVPRTVTPQQAGSAGLQTALNLAAPGMYSTLARVATPVGRVLGGSLIGGAMGAAYNPQDPGAGFVSGAAMAPAGEAVGGLAKGAVKGTATAADIARATPTAENLAARNKAMRTADTQNYTNASAEAAQAGGTSPDLENALQSEFVARYTNTALQSPKYRNASPAELAMQVNRMMNKTKVANNDAMNPKLGGKYDPNLEVQNDQIEAGQKELNDALGQLTPSFQQANTEHAQAMAGMQSVKLGGKQAKTIMRGTDVPEARMQTQGGPAFGAQIEGMQAPEAQNTLEGTLGRAQYELGRNAKSSLTPRWYDYGGAMIPYLARNAVALPLRQGVEISRIQPYIEALRDQAGNPLPQIPGGQQVAPFLPYLAPKNQQP